MKRPLISFLAVCTILLLALPSCGKRERAATGEEAHETIAPASPQPAPTGTEAMTQTIDVDEEKGGRSISEGGALTTDPTTTTPVTATTTTGTTTGTTATTTT
ncbi:MAG TPA: hypothetical protein VEK11_10600 [Thermoanaerobaculia bacterium]|nr:hypothetical protein [Thermoanaerobaculia bacterium]